MIFKLTKVILFLRLDKKIEKDDKAVGTPRDVVKRRINKDVKNLRAVQVFGFIFTFLLGIVAIAYLVISILASFDSHGREVYFADDPKEVYDFVEAQKIVENDPNRTMYTDNWGYFYNAHKRSDESYWDRYDVLPHIWITAGVTTFLWLLLSVMDIYKYIVVVWQFAIPTFFLALITIVLNVFGSVIIGLRIHRFDSDNSDFWQLCNCKPFKRRFYTSIRMEFYATLGVLAIAILHFILEIVFWVKKPKTRINP